MIDFHSHILPGVDDGSKDIQESLELLKMLKSQGVTTVVATPHFDPERETAVEFVSRRQEAYDTLIPHTENSPRILMGAEVIYYDGISSLDGLDKLCIDNTRILLLEMPMCKWSAYAIKELKNLSCIKGYTVLLAHIERYMKFQSSQVWQEILQLGVLCQVNASFFLRPLTRKKALSMLLKGAVNVIGSDCHNVDTRSPQIGAAFDFIKGKLGDDFLSDFTEYNHNLLFGD